MKEFGFIIDCGGLAPDQDSLDGAQYLKNLVPDKGAWRVPRIPTMPSGWDNNAQVFRGRAFTLLCNQTSISTVNETTMVRSTITTVPQGDGWSVADFGTVWIAANGVQVVSRWPEEEGTFQILNQNNPRFGCVCAHLYTRLVYGDCPQGQNWVGWSCMDGADIPYLLSGQDLPDRLRQRNEANVAPMPFRGKVQAIIPMGNNLVVYGEDGICALSLEGANYGVVPLVGLPSNVGISTRQSACGTNDRQLFVDREGAIYQIAPDLTVTKLECVLTAAANASVAYNERDDEVWISGSATSLVITKAGIGGPVEAVVRCFVQLPGGFYAAGTGYGDSIRAEAWTNVVDAGDVSLKRLIYLRFGVDGITGLRAGLKARCTTGDSLVQFPWSLCSPEGAGFMNLALLSGQIGLNGVAVPGSRVWRVEVRIQAGDKRYIRGTRGVPKEEE